MLCGVEHALIHGERREAGIQRGGDDERVLLRGAALRVQPVACLALLDGTGQVEAEHVLTVRRALRTGQQRIARVEGFLVVLPECLPVEGVGPRLGQNLDASEPRPFVFRRKGIGVDAHFPNRRLVGQVAAGEAIDINLSAVGTRAGPGHRLQLLRQLVGIVRERREFLLAQHQRGAVRRGIGGDAIGLVFDIQYLRVGLNQ